jgi:hypothetical protein
MLMVQLPPFVQSELTLMSQLSCELQLPRRFTVQLAEAGVAANERAARLTKTSICASPIERSMFGIESQQRN